MLLRGKLAVVAGFGAGMARQVAVSLAREGADLVVYGGAEPVMVSTAGEIAALGRKAMCVPAAAADRSTADALATRVRDIFGRVDILVHTTPLPPAPVRFEDADLDEWRGTVEADVFGPLLLTQSLLPLLRVSGDARVVVIGNRSGSVASAGLGAHHAAQSALASLARTLARELGPDGVRVNVVQPGFPEPVADPDREPGVAAPSDEEVAGAVVFLASPLSKAVTGQALHVDAGLWLA